MSIVTRIASLVVASLLVLASHSAAAQDPVVAPSLDRFDRGHVDHVRLLLSGYHGLPDRAALDDVPDARQIVLAFAHSDAPLVRDRALAALGHFWPSGDVFLLYATTLASPDTPDGTRHRAMILAAEVFGDRAVPMIVPYLGNADVQLRLTAVEALGHVRNDAAVAALEERRTVEGNAVVLERIDDATRVLR